MECTRPTCERISINLALMIDFFSGKFLLSNAASTNVRNTS